MLILITNSKVVNPNLVMLDMILLNKPGLLELMDHKEATHTEHQQVQAGEEAKEPQHTELPHRECTVRMRTHLGMRLTCYVR